MTGLICVYTMQERDILPEEIIVAGQICVDILLQFDDTISDLASLVVPGRCVIVQDSGESTGGAVANTGLALHQLGVNVKLISRIGNDPYGQRIIKLLEKARLGLSNGLIKNDEDATAFSIVLNAPGVDRSFLYAPGANYSFSSSDITDKDLAGARLLHFGYPPELKHFYLNAGADCVKLFSLAKANNLIISMDMAFPDHNSEPGKVDWREWLKNVLPYVDIFMPSFREICFMLRPKIFAEVNHLDDTEIPENIIVELGQTILDLGARISIIKLGARGLYLSTTDNTNELSTLGRGNPFDVHLWSGLQLWQPSFKPTSIASTTGAGDCAIAGFLASFLRGFGPEESLKMAAAVGAFNLEQVDASSGVPHWDVVRNRVIKGWTTNPI